MNTTKLFGHLQAVFFGVFVFSSMLTLLDPLTWWTALNAFTAGTMLTLTVWMTIHIKMDRMVNSMLESIKQHVQINEEILEAWKQDHERLLHPPQIEDGEQEKPTLH